MNQPFIKFYVRDWLSDPELRMVSLAARGFWFECLCIMHGAKRRGYMETPFGVPINDDQLARLIGTFKGEIMPLKDELTAQGIPGICENTGIWYSRRMVKETEKSEKCGEAGRRGGGSPLLQSGEKLDIRIQKPYKIKGDLYTSPLKVGFDEFWSAYPRKIGKKAALKAWAKATDKPGVQEIIGKINELKSTHEWQKDGGQFIPHPATWLNEGRWSDSAKIEVAKKAKNERYVEGSML